MTTPAVPPPPAPPQPDPPAPGNANPPNPPAPPAPPQPAGPSGGEDEPSVAPKWLNMRLAQAKTSALKALGFESEEQAKERLGALKKLEDEAEERRKASLSEVEREKEARLAAERERDAATQRANAVERAAKVTRACAERGIKNVDYAEFVLAKAELSADFGQVLDGLIAERPGLKEALQLTVPTTSVTPPNTNPGIQPPPPAPPAPPANDAMAMKADDWAKERQRLGIR